MHDTFQFLLVGEGDADFSFASSRIAHLYFGLEQVGHPLAQHVEFFWQCCSRSNSLGAYLYVLAILQILNQFFDLRTE